MSTISLVLKLAATSLFGMVAFFSHRKLRRDEALFFQRRDILRRTTASSKATLPFSRPPTILILGLRAHGKSSFINTACRVLSGEDGPLVLRTGTAPPGTTPWTPVTRSDRVVKVVMGWWWDEKEEEEEYEDDEVVVVEMVDTPGISPLAIGINLKEEVEKTLLRWSTTGTADCVVVVVRCPGADIQKRMGVLRMIGEVSSAVREHGKKAKHAGLNIVVVLTDKKAMKNDMQVEELRKEAMVMARTDCVYVIDNYTSESGRPFSTSNNFETHFNVLAIIRQCMEYSMIHRNNQNKEKANTSTTSSVPLLAKLPVTSL